ncbi:MAG: 2-succinyl-5-enolpyruvyl-6-hydroxy-3-cyclohexene-1-carboxylic-acid synthase [Bacteroidia bacterium]
MIYPDKQHLADLIFLLRSYGLREVVICPGSRSAPLSLAFARQSDIGCSTVVDERSAAYIALGKSLATAEATALVCTSGTALLNFAPAVAEAFYLRIPLLILSADRPAAWVDQLDGQTIRQHEVLAKHTVFSASLPERADTPTDRWHAQRLVHEAWHKAHQLRGPVHLNIPLREPLYDALPQAVDLPEAIQHESAAMGELPQALAEAWKYASSILLVPGQQAPSPLLQEVLLELVNDPRLVVLSEPVANLPGFIAQHEAICSRMPAYLRPDLMISWGEQVVSKQLKIWLRKNPPAMHWRIDPLGQLAQPFGINHKLIACEPLHFFKQMAKTSQGEGDYRHQWERQQKQVEQRLSSFFDRLPYGDLFVMQQLAARIGREDSLHLGNSTPVRYWQMLLYPPPLNCLHANRGTSGIDGVSSTALGFASQSQHPVWLITGELSFCYDINAFTSSERPKNLKMVVVNNGGGDIFRLLDGPSTQPEREEFFATPRPVNIRALCEAWQIRYFRATDALSLQRALDELKQAEDMALLEAITEPSVNQNVYQTYQQLIKNNI